MDEEGARGLVRAYIRPLPPDVFRMKGEDGKGRTRDCNRPSTLIFFVGVQGQAGELGWCRKIRVVIRTSLYRYEPTYQNELYREKWCDYYLRF